MNEQLVYFIGNAICWVGTVLVALFVICCMLIAVAIPILKLCGYCWQRKHRQNWLAANAMICNKFSSHDPLFHFRHLCRLKAESDKKLTLSQVDDCLMLLNKMKDEIQKEVPDNHLGAEEELHSARAVVS